VPTLDLAALDARIRRRRLEPVHLFVGADARLIDRLIDAVEGTVDPADRPFAVERIYAAEPGGSPVDIAAAARILPMLGDRRIVIVMRAERLLKPKRATRTAVSDEEDDRAAAREASPDLAALEDYLDDPVPTTTLLFVASDVDRTRRFTKRVLEKAHVTEFGVAADGRADRAEARAAGAKLIQQELEQAHRAIDPAARDLLLDRAGADIARLRADVERLLLYTEGQSRVSFDDAAEIVSSETPAGDPFAMVNAIAGRDAARALCEVSSRLDRGESPHALVGQLRWWVSTRLPEGEADRARQAIDALLRTDLALKSSGGDDRVVMERLVVELTSLFRVQPPREP
jgi:DNA polymerase III delta subunit